MNVSHESVAKTLTHIYFGDAMHENVLHHVNILEAKALAISINDTVAAERIVKNARKLNSNLYIVVRTRYVAEMRYMFKHGADEVIPDDFGSSVEIFTRVLQKYEISKEEVQKIISEVRIEGYEFYKEGTK